MANLIGQTFLNQIHIESFIASGGMGAVYRVIDLKRNRPLAMKVLHADLADDPTVFKRFQREARALQQLRHPNVVPFYGLFQEKGQSFLLEEFIEGNSLQGILRERDGQPLPVNEVMIYMKGLCAALSYAHTNNIVHCDVKPGNVMVDRQGKIFLTDFGIARFVGATATTTLGIAGTPSYMAPEQIVGRGISPVTDIYALGVVLFEMLTGQRPFRGTEPESEAGGDTPSDRIRYAHLRLPPPDPRQINPNLNLALSKMILRGLTKNPAERIRSAQEFFLALCQAVQTQPDQISDETTIIGEFKPRPLPPVPAQRTSSTPHLRSKQKNLSSSQKVIVALLLVLILAIGGITIRIITSLVGIPPIQTATEKVIETAVVSAIFTATPLPSTETPTPTVTATMTPSPTISITETPIYTPSVICMSQNQIPETECEALVALYNSTNGAIWIDNTDWLQTDTPCSWFGVTCDAGHVTVLALGGRPSGNGLIGTVPPELGNLINLTELNLNDNQLTGSIPPELGNLKNLTLLNLHENQLSGSIPPELSNLTNLTQLNLYSNLLSGNIPPELSNLTSLQSLNLKGNQLTGSIPPEIGNLKNLTGLSLFNNQLTGSIPPEIGNLKNLTDLSLFANQLTGSIPSEIWHLVSLGGLYLDDNQLTGSIPAEIENLISLNGLGLSKNKLTGNIPSEIGNLASLEYLYLDNNQLTGNIPTEIGNLTSLTYLHLDSNQLTGNIPSEIGNLTSLESFYLGGNQLSGEIPASFTKLANLTDLSLNCGLISTKPAVTKFIDGILGTGWQCP